jgi:hypothetical protein
MGLCSVPVELLFSPGEVLLSVKTELDSGVIFDQGRVETLVVSGKNLVISFFVEILLLRKFCLKSCFFSLPLSLHPPLPPLLLSLLFFLITIPSFFTSSLP